MKRINIYDYDDERIDNICERFDMMPHEVIEILLDIVDGEEDEYFG